MATNRFTRRGTQGGVFECGICTRRTRNAGQAMSGLCPQCDEWTQIENSINDGAYKDDPDGFVVAEAAVAKLKAQAAAKGGQF